MATIAPGPNAETTAAPPPAAHAIDLTKTYGKGDAVVRALDGITVEFERGRFTAVMGPSGSGKSTLMHCMAGLDTPTSGRTFVGNREIGTLDDAGLTQMRRDQIGFVFQSFNLIPTLTATNIRLPATWPNPRWIKAGSTTSNTRTEPSANTKMNHRSRTVPKWYKSLRSRAADLFIVDNGDQDWQGTSLPF